MAEIQITMFGEFSLSYKGKTITENDNMGAKTRLLLQYLIANRDREIAQTELIELLWADSKNPGNAIKTLVHRTRALLDEFIPDGSELIESNHGTYSFSNRFDVCIDSAEFTRLISLAENEAISPSKRIKYYKSAFELYKGGYLCASGDETWVIPINVYFHTLYSTAVEKCAQLLYPLGRFTDIVNICERAVILDPADEKIHVCLIKAMIALEDYERAALQYEYVKKYLLEQFGTTPGRRLTELYELTVKPGRDSQKDFDIVIGDLSDEKEKKGVFYCEYEIFRYIFRLCVREAVRLDKHISMCLITLAAPDEESDRKRYEKAVQKLSECVLKSLRMSDVYTRFSATQYILMLNDADESAFEPVRERIMTKYRRSKTLSDIKVKFEFKCLR